MPTSDQVDVQQTLSADYLRQIFVRAQMSDYVTEPFVMARAQGVHYWDVHGNKYLDVLSGIYVTALGHSNSRVIEAVKRQMDVLNLSPPMHGTNPMAIRLANKLADVAPGDLNAVKLCSGGSESTETAIVIARQYHKRRVGTEPLAPGFIHVFPPTCYRCPFGKAYPDCDITCATLIENVIELEGPETVAAVMVEPIGHTGGIVEPPVEYLPLLRQLYDRHGVLLIFDEIITGLGRTGQMFAADTFGVVPDLLCAGKALAAGYAQIMAVLMRQHVADAFWGDADENPGLVTDHTQEGSPTACAAALATLAEIEERNLCANARRVGQRLRQGLESLHRHGIIGDIRGKGLFLGMEFVRDSTTRERFGEAIGTRIGKRALELGMLARYDEHWLAIGPPLIITDDHADEIVAILDQSISDVLNS